LGNCENFVGKKDELVFDTFINSEQVERTYDGSDMTRDLGALTTARAR